MGLNTLIASIAERSLLFAVQQFVPDRDVADIGSGADHRVYKARVGIHANMRLHAEKPLVALLRLMHLGVTLLVPILGRTRRSDDRGVDHSAFTKHQTFGREMFVDRGEDRFGQRVLLEQAPELEQRGRIGHALSAQIHAHETTDRLTVVQRILNAFVGQAKALLGDIHAQHALQADGRATSAAALWVVRFDRRHQSRPGRNRIDLFQKPIAPRLALLGSVLKVRKALLQLLAPLTRHQQHCLSYALSNEGRS